MGNGSNKPEIHRESESIAVSINVGVQTEADQLIGNPSIESRITNKESTENTSTIGNERPKSLLYEAICGCDVLKVTEIHEKNPDVINSKYSANNTPLHLAAIYGNVEMVDYFLRHLDINIRNRDKCIPLHFAVLRGDVEIVKHLLENGSQISIKAQRGSTPLHNAASQKDYRIVKLLIEHQENDEFFDINIKTISRETPLHFAVYYSQISVVEYLLQKTANTNSQNKLGRTPLHYAVNNKNVEIVEMLLENGADVNISDNDMNSPLHFAATAGHLDIVKLLVRHVAKITIKDKNGFTALYFAAKEGTIHVVEFLLKSTLEFADDPMSLVAPMQVALLKGHCKIVKLLLQHCFNINAWNENDTTTLLHTASENGSFDIVNYLLAEGADINARDTHGRTALHFAVINHHIGIVNLLLDAGANANLQDNQGRLPLYYAITPDILGCLFARGDRFTAQELEQRLDDCMQVDQNENVYFNYDSLLEQKFSSFESTLPIFYYLSKEKKFEHILRHPTIRIVINLRWKQISPYYFINLFFSIVACSIVFCYQILIYTADNYLGPFGYICYVLLLLSFIFFFFREIIQINISWKSYFENAENYFELSFVFYIALITTWYPEMRTRIQVTSLGNVLIAVCVTMMIGHHPIASSAVHLLRIVTSKFMKYFLAYWFIIFSFALSLFQLQNIKQDLSINSTSIDRNHDTLKTFDIIIVQTMGMLLGELNLNDFFSVPPNLMLIVILILFITFLSIIMLNLLNGLAISGILEKNELEISYYKSQLEYLYHMNGNINWITKTILNENSVKLRVINIWRKLRSSVKNCYQRAKDILKNPTNTWHELTIFTSDLFSYNINYTKPITKIMRDRLLNLLRGTNEKIYDIIILPDLKRRKSNSLNNNQVYIYNMQIYKDTCERLKLVHASGREPIVNRANSSFEILTEVLSRLKQLEDDIKEIKANNQVLLDTHEN